MRPPDKSEVPSPSSFSRSAFSPSPQNTDSIGVQRVFGARTLLARSGVAPVFAHEETWRFLCYLNVLLKCLPAIVAKPPSFIVRGVKKRTNAFSIHFSNPVREKGLLEAPTPVCVYMCVDGSCVRACV